MDPELREQLLRLNADQADHNIEPERVVWLACDLLIAGLDTPALCELAGESPTRLEKGEAGALVRQFLVELGMEPMTHEQADWFIGRETARKVLAGAPSSEWDNDVWRITVRLASEYLKNDDVFAASANFDADPGPFLDFVRKYLQIAEDQLTGW